MGTHGMQKLPRTSYKTQCKNQVKTIVWLRGALGTTKEKLEAALYREIVLKERVKKLEQELEQKCKQRGPQQGELPGAA